eukprot:TRINITY_DN1456_c1_g3_i1.p1 TRINITY_DN1456_c1_g3~~TRINITY_DN1456_c1_g3_i1.p1  ORF type:complete len:687 (-),score=181.52 TRINITY_DN1456_c1_g3_i1:111-2150(-)
MQDCEATEEESGEEEEEDCEGDEWVFVDDDAPPAPALADVIDPAAGAGQGAGEYLERALVELARCGGAPACHRLLLCRRNWEALSRGALTAAGTAPFVVSLIGDTHTGKTSLVKALQLEPMTLDDLLAATQPADAGDCTERKLFCGTSANVCLHRAEPPQQQHATSVYDKSTCGAPVIYVLDMEGQDAAGIPAILQQLQELAPTLDMPQSDAASRRAAVNRMLPLLAYFVSDLVVFIDTSTFDNTKFVTRVRQFIAAIGKIADLQCEPHLLLVSNKCALKGQSAGVWDITECTTKFLSAEDGEHAAGLAAHSSVTCLCLPDWNAADMHRVGGELRASPAGAVKYVQQVNALQLRLRALYAQRIDERARWGTAVSERAWLEVFRLVVDDFPTSLELSRNTKALTWSSKFYSVVSASGSDDVATINALFSQLVEYVNRPELSNAAVQRQFAACRDVACVCLAARLALRVKARGLSRVLLPPPPPPPRQQSPSLVTATTTAASRTIVAASAPAQTAAVRLAALRDFIVLVDEQRICAAVCTRPGAAELRCTQPRRFHGELHRNPMPLSGPDAAQGLCGRLAGYFGYGFPAIWPGEFEAVDTQDNVPPLSEASFLRLVNAFLEMDRRAVLQTVCCQLGAALKRRPLPRLHGLCLLCLAPQPQSQQQQPLCDECLAIWREVHSV